MSPFLTLYLSDIGLTNFFYLLFILKYFTPVILCGTNFFLLLIYKKSHRFQMGPQLSPETLRFPLLLSEMTCVTKLCEPSLSYFKNHESLFFFKFESFILDLQYNLRLYPYPQVFLVQIAVTVE